MLFRGPAPEACVAVELDPFTALFHRPSGTTHLLIEPAPQLLTALRAGPLTLAGLRSHLAALFDLPDGSDDALSARLDELVEAGLIEAVEVEADPVGQA